MTTKFIKVRCSKCKNEQNIFGKSSTTVNCLVCEKPLAESAGGNARIKSKIIEILE